MNTLWSVSCELSVADWELRRAATTQHHKRKRYHIMLTQEKIKIQSAISPECILLSHTVVLKTVNLAIINQDCL